MIPNDRLQQIRERFEFLEARMATGGGDIAALGREYAELRPVGDQIAEWHRLQADLAEAEALLADPEMRALAEEELPRLRARLPEAERALQLSLLPRDAADARPAILEIRPGTGGEEAALFAADLARMYQRYATSCSTPLRITRAVFSCRSSRRLRALLVRPRARSSMALPSRISPTTMADASK